MGDFLEEADSDEPKSKIGTMTFLPGDTEGIALERASVLYEHPTYDLMIHRLEE